MILGYLISNVLSALLEVSSEIHLPEVVDLSDSEDIFADLSNLALTEPVPDAADDEPLGSLERDVDTILKLFLRNGIDGETVVLI